MRIAALVLALAGSPALACMPAENARTLPREAGPQCAQRQVVEGPADFIMSEATDLGHGRVLQTVSQFFVNCGGPRIALVMDCAAGQIAVFGMPSVTISDGLSEADFDNLPFNRLVARIEAAAAAGSPLSTADITARARAADLPDVATAALTSRLTYNGWPFTVDCGCKLYYPELGQ